MGDIIRYARYMRDQGWGIDRVRDVKGDLALSNAERLRMQLHHAERHKIVRGHVDYTSLVRPHTGLQLGFSILLARAGHFSVFPEFSGFIGATPSSRKEVMVERIQDILSPGFRFRMAAPSYRVFHWFLYDSIFIPRNPHAI